MHYVTKLSIHLLFSAVLLTASLAAQRPVSARPAEKILSPSAARVVGERTAGSSRFFVGVRDVPAFRKWLVERGVSPTAIVGEEPRASGLLVYLPHYLVRDQLVANPLVTFVDVHTRSATPERAIPGLDLSANKINLLRHHYPELSGAGMALSIKENAFDSTDIDLRGRYLPNRGRDPAVTTHATNVATMAAGAGNSFYTGEGPARAAFLSSSSFQNLFPDNADYFLDQGISVQNHSYGLGVENYYGAEALVYDDQVYGLKSLLHVFSAGNLGEATGADGPYAAVPGYANLTGTMKMAKNVFTVGAVDTLLRVVPRSSRGPAYDGRIKPELVAFGWDGTSGAAALTSGTLLLVQQAYRERHGTLPPASLVRAAVLNSADDIGTPGPDFAAGYGNLNAYGAVTTIREKRYFQGVLANGETATFPLAVPANARNLKLTLAWTDPRAEINAPRALVNDLDLSVVAVGSSSRHLPLVLNTSPHADSLALPAVPGSDRLNPQEQIVIADPIAENYEVVITGFALAGGSQRFSVAYEWELPGFRWTFPLRDDPVEAGQPRALRWMGPGEGRGNLAFRYLDGGAWTPVANDLPVADGQYLWTVPPGLGRAQLSMTLGEQTYFSDTFLISRAPDLTLLLDCEEELGLGWTPRETETGYRLYGQEEETVTELLTTTDDFLLLDREEYAYEYLSLAGLFPGNREGIRSPALNLDFQVAGCYQEQFLASVTGEQVELELRLGLAEGIERVIFERREETGYREIGTVAAPATLFLTGSDPAPRPGLNVYRATVVLRDGTIRSGREASVIFVAGTAYVYPNPTTPEEGAGILLKNFPAEDAYFSLYAADGRLLRRFLMLGEAEELPLTGLARGAYPYRVISGGAVIVKGVVIIQ